MTSPDTPQSYDERVTAEIAAVAQGGACGFHCVHHGDQFPPCERPAGHKTDAGGPYPGMHVSHLPDGSLITASDLCCFPDPNAPPWPQEPPAPLV